MSNKIKCKKGNFLLLNKGRVAIIPSDFLAILISESKKALGNDVAESLAYHLGRAVGVRFYNMMQEVIEELDLDEAADYFGKFMMDFGWGKLINVEITDDYIDIYIGDLFECAVQTSKTPSSHFTTGFIEGLVSRLLASRVMVKELKCIAAGDEYCLFRIYHLK